MSIKAKEQFRQQQHLQLSALRYYFDRRTLEAHLTSLLEAAHLEQSRGRLAGAPIFAVLASQAIGQVSSHCKRWELDSQRVEAELPSMAELRSLTMPAVSAYIRHNGNRWLMIALAAIAISVALTSDWVWNLPLLFK